MPHPASFSERICAFDPELEESELRNRGRSFVSDPVETRQDRIGVVGRGLNNLHASSATQSPSYQSMNFEADLSTDRPIPGRLEDKLSRAGFADAIATAIRSWRGKDSLVLALYGEWGSGKSSIKNMILEACASPRTTSYHWLLSLTLGTSPTAISSANDSSTRLASFSAAARSHPPRNKRLS